MEPSTVEDGTAGVYPAGFGDVVVHAANMLCQRCAGIVLVAHYPQKHCIVFRIQYKLEAAEAIAWGAFSKFFISKMDVFDCDLSLEVEIPPLATTSSSTAPLPVAASTVTPAVHARVRRKSRAYERTKAKRRRVLTGGAEETRQLEQVKAVFNAFLMSGGGAAFQGTMARQYQSLLGNASESMSPPAWKAVVENYRTDAKKKLNRVGPDDDAETGTHTGSKRLPVSPLLPSFQIAGIFAGELLAVSKDDSRNFGPVSLTGPEIELVCWTFDYDGARSPSDGALYRAEWLFGYRECPSTTRAAGSSNDAVGPATVEAVAALMAWSCLLEHTARRGPRRGPVSVLDPMCGVGTLPSIAVEMMRLLSFVSMVPNALHAHGCELLGPAVSRARARCGHQVDLVCCSTTRLPYGENTMNVVLVDPPWGHRHLSHSEVKHGFRRWLKEWARVLSAIDGILGIVTIRTKQVYEDIEAINRSQARQSLAGGSGSYALSVLQDTLINFAGHNQCRFFLLQKTPTAR
eukprot:Stramenopile-MAST_4_protein_2666